MSRGRVIAQAGATAVLVVIVDLVTKLLVRDGLQTGTEHEVVGQLLRVVHAENNGVAFGGLSGKPVLVALLVVVAVSALLAYFLTHLEADGVWLPTGMLVGGAAGNAIDRVSGGSVTDFVKFPALAGVQRRRHRDHTRRGRAAGGRRARRARRGASSWSA